ncbi:carbohydrate ABC transporter permease [Mesobacillus stamsii]|uniref:Multiple sugar transport system permease protein n=1 Tax=Mesobacillus stamsii TaxID=225347 RepID=A0ABU0FYR6_9BACI|nr:carbohydrate ABC transporter permease [Mesobacillus stamsii]MDQ0415081.1 multiple sugar transport system permease protein [Mesobacillus stamsii]
MKQNSTSKIVAFVFLIIMAILWAFPILWGIFTSFKSEEEITAAGATFLPIHWSISNYAELLFNNQSTPIVKWFTNSLIISVGHTILVLVVVSLASYGYTRLEFKGRDLLFGMLLASMMFPGIVNLIPLYGIMDKLGWVNNFLAVIVPGAAGVFNIFLVRQFVLGIPKTFDESARIDGASEFQIFWHIILPLLKPVLTVVALFSFTGAWNDFLWPSIVLNDIDKLPITPGLQLLQGQYLTYPGIGTAGALIALVPTFLLYLFAQRYFMQSMSLSSGVKG